MNKKLKEWLNRYIPAEIFSTIGALTGAGLIFFFTNNRILSAFAGMILENIGYYGFIVVREYVTDLKKSKEKYGILGFFKTLRNLSFEFGFSEILDSLIVRPFFMYIIPLMISPFSLGILIAKIIADIIFYIPTIIAYELRKKHLK
jgi:hypothetical protein